VGIEPAPVRHQHQVLVAHQLVGMLGHRRHRLRNRNRRHSPRMKGTMKGTEAGVKRTTGRSG
ncbi:MAG: hypothetical protein JRM97_09465, partial [Nitrososphaerota archaeon]|nr:hypothetical protein [Nitrososphaerota archaeon]